MTLRTLLGDVADSEVLVLLQSAGVLTRPWCLLEILTAIVNKVPIVCVNVLGPNRYDHSSAFTFMTHLDTELDRVNPGASRLIAEHDMGMRELARRLYSVFIESAARKLVPARPDCPRRPGHPLRRTRRRRPL